jgi:hypothetical protein
MNGREQRRRRWGAPSGAARGDVKLAISAPMAFVPLATTALFLYRDYAQIARPS